MSQMGSTISILNLTCTVFWVSCEEILTTEAQRSQSSEYLILGNSFLRALCASAVQFPSPASHKRLKTHFYRRCVTCLNVSLQRHFLIKLGDLHRPLEPLTNHLRQRGRTGSPGTMYVIRGGFGNVPSQRKISP